MKKIVKRKTGDTLTIEEAISLCNKIKAKTGTSWTDETSVYGYSSAELAKRANLRAMIEEREKNYIFAFIDAVKVGFEGYKVRCIASKIKPADLEALFPDYVVLG